MGKYFFIYIRIFLNLVLFLFISNIVYLSQIISFNYFYLIIIVLLLTLSGLPPFFIFEFLLKIGFFLIVLFLILRSFISLFYYIRFRIYMFIYLNFKKFRIEINFSYIFG